MPASEIHIAFQRNLFRLLLWNYAAAPRVWRIFLSHFEASAQLDVNLERQPRSRRRWGLDFDDGHFLWRWDGNVFFPRHHCHRWVFNGLTIPGPSTLNVFLQINNWNWWFFYGFPKFRCNSQRWFWPWQRPENAHNHDISPFATTVLII